VARFWFVDWPEGCKDANDVLKLVTQGNPRKLGCPGENLPHVLYRLVDPAEHSEQDILVVGAGDSALEIAIALAEENRVGLVVRGPEIARANEVLTKEILGLQATGQLTIYYNANVKQVYAGYADLSVRGDVTRVPAELIFLKLGADAPRKFFESVGIRYSGDGKDARPILSPVHESSVPGLFLIGAASNRDLIKLGMNQGWEVIEHLMGREVEPADEAVLKEKLPYWEGSVRERIASLRSRVPLLAVADEQQLRETFLATRVREYANGETIIRQRIEQLEKRHLVGHIEEGRRLIEYERIPLLSESACNSHPLPLASGELVSAAIDELIHACAQHRALDSLFIFSGRTLP